MSLVSLVILDDIEVPTGLQEKFDTDKIDRAAQNIIALGGLIRPLILQRLNYEIYKLISGEFELAAMLRAQEIDSNFEQAGCFICGTNTLLGDLDETYLHEAVELFVDSDKKENSSKEVNECVGLKAENEALEIQIDELQDKLDKKENLAKQVTNDAAIEKERQAFEKERHDSLVSDAIASADRIEQTKNEIADMKKQAAQEIEILKREAQEKLIEERAGERARLAGFYKPNASYIRELIMNFINLEGQATVKEVWLHLAEHGYDFERRQVGQRLAYLNKKGLIERVGRGMYSIAAK